MKQSIIKNSSTCKPFKCFYNRIVIIEIKCALLCEDEQNYEPLLSNTFNIKIKYRFRRNKDINDFINYCTNTLGENSIRWAHAVTEGIDTTPSECEKQNYEDLQYYVKYVDAKLFPALDMSKLKTTTPYKKYMKAQAKKGKK